MSSFAAEAPFDSTAVLSSATAVLERTHLCSMATVNADGTAYANTAFFAQGTHWRFFFISHEDSRHATNLARQPSMSWTVFDSRQEWGTELHGLQLYGRAARVGLLEAPLALHSYCRDFSGFAQYIAGKPLQEVFDSPYRFFVFEPFAGKLIDEASFGEETYVPFSLRPK